MLDLLYHLRRDILSYAIMDEKCFPILQKCAIEIKLGCYTDFYQCQMGDSTGLIIDAETSIAEINAVLFQRAYAQHLSPELLHGLCLKIDNAIPNPLMQNIYELASQSRQGVYFGFLNQVTLEYLNAHQIHCSNLLKFAVTMTAVLGVSMGNYMTSDSVSASFSLQVLFPTAALMLAKGIEEITSRFATPRVAQMTKNITQTLFVGSQIATAGVVKILANIAASTAGYWTGTKIGKYAGGFFGSSKDNAVPQIQSHKSEHPKRPSLSIQNYK